MYDSFSDSDDEPSFTKALHVQLPNDFDPAKVPQNGEEYVQHVMYEAKHCMKLVVASVDKRKLRKPTYTLEQNEDCVKAPKLMVPTLEWQEKHLEDFSRFAKYLESVIDEHATDDNFNEAVLKDTLETTTPKLALIAKLGQGAKIRLLQEVTTILQRVKPGGTVRRELGVWIYSILATFEIPLTPNAYHCLRELARQCSVMRAKLPLSSEESLYAPLNLFICLVARYFKQLDLVDDENDL